MAAPEQILKVSILTEKGVSDPEISNMLNINISSVGNITTLYWKCKMDLKQFI